VACGQESVGKYFTDVVAGIDQVITQHPELFDFTDTNLQGEPHLKSLDGYGNAVAEAVAKKGYCTRWTARSCR